MFDMQLYKSKKKLFSTIKGIKYLKLWLTNFVIGSVYWTEEISIVGSTDGR